MKTISLQLRVLVTVMTFGVLASIVNAGPGVQYWKSLGTESQFKQLKTREPIVYVCNQCKTVSEVKIESQEHAMELCKEGTTIKCPSCKTKVRIVRKTKRNDPATHTEVIYVNEKGEECGFFARITK
jgi:DNA-directed RNA polymerase subunit RPC12/RpoP